MTKLDWYDEYLFRVHGFVEQCGFFIQGVIGEGNNPSYGYTIGLLAHGHPELVVYGLDDVSMHGALHCLYNEIVSGVHRPVGRDHEQALGDGGQIRLLPMSSHYWSNESTLLNTAVNYYSSLGWREQDFAALQFVWATPTGEFPWDAECSARFRHLQPILDPGAAAAA